MTSGGWIIFGVACVEGKTLKKVTPIPRLNEIWSAKLNFSAVRDTNGCVHFFKE